LGTIINRQNTQQNLSLAQIIHLQTEYERVSKDLHLTLEDKAELKGNSAITKYSFREFGLYSPLLETKEMIVKTYRYRARDIISKRIIVSKNNDQEIAIESFEFNEMQYMYVGVDSEKSHAVIERDEFEHRVTVLELKERWDEKYTNPNSIEFYINQQDTRFGTHVHFDHYEKKNGVIGYPVLFRISKYISNDPKTGMVSSTMLTNVEKELKIVADSFNTRKE
jgi:hypothetical protein